MTEWIASFGELESRRGEQLFPFVKSAIIIYLLSALKNLPFFRIAVTESWNCLPPNSINEHWARLPRMLYILVVEWIRGTLDVDQVSHRRRSMPAGSEHDGTRGVTKRRLETS